MVDSNIKKFIYAVEGSQRLQNDIVKYIKNTAIGYGIILKSVDIRKDILSLYLENFKVNQLITKGEIVSMLGGWNFDDFKGANLPQKVASGFAAVFGGFTGADYQPIVYLGSQVVNGTNYLVIAKQTLVTKIPEEHIVKIVINEAPDGTFSLVSISGVA